VADCPFCLIVAGDTQAYEVLRTPLVCGFLDIRPVFKGHVLVVPTQHLTTLADAPGALIEPLFTQVQRVSQAVIDGLGAQGSFVAVNNTVSQTVPHLHVHVVPRSKGDGLRGFFWPRVKYADGEAERYAARLRAALGDRDGTFDE